MSSVKQKWPRVETMGHHETSPVNNYGQIPGETGVIRNPTGVMSRLVAGPQPRWGCQFWACFPRV